MLGGIYTRERCFECGRKLQDNSALRHAAPIIRTRMLFMKNLRGHLYFIAVRNSTNTVPGARDFLNCSCVYFCLEISGAGAVDWL